MELSSETKQVVSYFTSDYYEERLNKSKITRLFTPMRPAYTEAEEHFVQKYLMCEPLVAKGMYQDGYGDRGESGNCLMRIPTESGEDSKTLWSCHTDSVHYKGGVQTVHYNPDDDKFSTPDGSCLGSDDNSGTYVLLELIRNNVPGLYVFHRAEEVGGCGSSWIASHCHDMLESCDRAIAFDRMDTHSIITHQGSSRCCSEAFSQDLSEKLGMNHRSDSTGSFTDTANYDHVIPECTNMSVGYYSAHSARENQLLDYLVRLKDAFVRIDVEGLVTDRNPDAPKEWSAGGYYGYGSTLLKPHKEARTEMGWAKQDDIKWRQDKKKKSDLLPTDDFISGDTTISSDDLLEIIDDDYGPKSKTEKKHHELTEDEWMEEQDVEGTTVFIEKIIKEENDYDDDEPDWNEFFGNLSD